MNFTVTETTANGLSADVVQFDTVRDVREYIIDALDDLEGSLDPYATGMTVASIRQKVDVARRKARSTKFEDLDRYTQRFVSYPGGMFAVVRN